MDESTVTVTKRCTKCGEEKPCSSEFFYRQSRGLHPWCRLCFRAGNIARARRNGIEPKPPLDRRFWSKVDKNGPTPAHRPELGPCWVWTGFINESGYGRINSRPPNRNKLAHRVAWVLTNGPVHKDTLVLHHCDNRPCVNPGHLFVGTHTDNMRDMIEKGRYVHGAKKLGAEHRNSKLTEQDIRDIRASMSTCRDIADKYGISPSNACLIRRGKAWKHVL